MPTYETSLSIRAERRAKETRRRRIADAVGLALIAALVVGTIVLVQVAYGVWG